MFSLSLARCSWNTLCMAERGRRQREGGGEGGRERGREKGREGEGDFIMAAVYVYLCR